MRKLLASAGLAALLVSLSNAAHSQERSGDNAIDQADDAFGLSVGRESIGIYTASNTRGFSPTAAGNVRINGLYFDPVVSLPGLIIDSSTVRVGLSAQGFPFSAPSGIVDQSLREPGGKAGASLVVSGDSFGSGGAELTGTVPILSKLSLGFGLAGNHVEFADGTSNWNHDQALIARWTPVPEVEIVPFWTLSNDYDDEAGTVYVPPKGTLPPDLPLGVFVGPGWVDLRYTATAHGVVSTVRPNQDWAVRLGIFRSVLDQESQYSNLFVDAQPDGYGRRVVVADPPLRNVGLSGELRITRTFKEGPRQHEFHFNRRDRWSSRTYGGEDILDLGRMHLNDRVKIDRPGFDFGPQSHDLVRQSALGIGYSGRWRRLGELGFSVSRAHYSKATQSPGEPEARSEARPWLYDANIALFPFKGVALYGGVARGLEESGVAPANATNRNQPLQAILTEQRDAGVRVQITKDLKAIAGIFDLQRPYFGFDGSGRYDKVGTVRSRGAEFSLTGIVTSRLRAVVGAVLLDPRVERDDNAASPPATRPFALPRHLLTLNLNWSVPGVERLTIDGSIVHRSRVPATSDGEVWLPSKGRVDIGGRYRMKLGERDATLRVQVNNLLDVRGLGLSGPGVYSPSAGRYASGYLTIDF